VPGGFSFKKTESGYDVKDIGVDNAGAIEGLTAVVNLIKEGVLPKGSTPGCNDAKDGQRRACHDGKWSVVLGRIFARAESISISLRCLVLVDIQADLSWALWSALINRSSPNAEFAMQFLEKLVCTADGLKALDADAPLGVPAVKSLADEMSAANPLIKATPNAHERSAWMSTNTRQRSEIEIDSALANIRPRPRTIYHRGKLSAGHLLHHYILGRAFRKHALLDKIYDCRQTLYGAGIVHADVLDVIAALIFLKEKPPALARNGKVKYGTL